MPLTVNINTPDYASRAYNAANFSVVGGGISTAATDYVDRYKVINKTLFWELTCECTLSSAPNEVRVTLPNSYQTKNVGGSTGCYIEGNGFCITNYAGTYISIVKADGTDFTDGGTYIYINLTLEIL